MTFKYNDFELCANLFYDVQLDKNFCLCSILIALCYLYRMLLNFITVTLK